MTKIIVVFLGTGAQAAGLVQRCLADPDFMQRIVTRDPEAEKVQVLVAKVRCLITLNARSSAPTRQIASHSSSHPSMFETHRERRQSKLISTSRSLRRSLPLRRVKHCTVFSWSRTFGEAPV